MPDHVVESLQELWWASLACMYRIISAPGVPPGTGAALIPHYLDFKSFVLLWSWTLDVLPFDIYVFSSIWKALIVRVQRMFTYDFVYLD